MIENSKSNDDKKKNYDYINKHHKSKYERFTVFVPKKEIIDTKKKIEID